MASCWCGESSEPPVPTRVSRPDPSFPRARSTGGPVLGPPGGSLELGGPSWGLPEAWSSPGGCLGGSSWGLPEAAWSLPGGPSWGPPGGRPVLAPVLGPVLGPPGGCLELSWGVEERAGASWGPFWGLLEPERPEALLGLPGALLGLSWALLGLPGALLGLPGALLGLSWGPFGALGALLGPWSWGSAGGSPGALRGLSWGSPGPS